MTNLFSGKGTGTPACADTKTYFSWSTRCLSVTSLKSYQTTFAKIPNQTNMIRYQATFMELTNFVFSGRHELLPRHIITTTADSIIIIDQSNCKNKNCNENFQTPDRNNPAHLANWTATCGNELLLIHFCHHYSGTEQPVAHISVHWTSLVSSWVRTGQSVVHTHLPKILRPFLCSLDIRVTPYIRHWIPQISWCWGEIFLKTQLTLNKQ